MVTKAKAPYDDNPTKSLWGSVKSQTFQKVLYVLIYKVKVDRPDLNQNFDGPLT